MIFSGGSDGKESVYNTGDPGSITGSGRFPGKGNGNPLQYSCLENSMDRAAWRATVYAVLKSWTGEGNDNPLQYSCLENSMHNEVWRATVNGVTKSWTQLSY